MLVVGQRALELDALAKPLFLNALFSSFSVTDIRLKILVFQEI